MNTPPKSLNTKEPFNLPQIATADQSSSQKIPHAQWQGRKVYTLAGIQLKLTCFSSQQEHLLPAFTFGALSVKRKVTSMLRRAAKYIYRFLPTLFNQRIKQAFREVTTLKETRNYGDRYPHAGIPKGELPYYVNPSIVVVKGMSINPAGHAFLAFGNPSSPNARFAQINAADACPEFLTPKQMQDYLEREGGEIIDVFTPSKRPGTKHSDKDMQKYLLKLSTRHWRWRLRKHNCLSFCIDVVKKGGYDVKELDNALVDIPRQGMQHIRTQTQCLRDAHKHRLKTKKLTQRDIKVLHTYQTIRAGKLQ